MYEVPCTMYDVLTTKKSLFGAISLHMSEKITTFAETFKTIRFMKKLLFWSIMVVSLAACSGNKITITYTSSDGKIIEVKQTAFDAEIVSNTYENGEGKIVFDKPLTSIGDWAFLDCKSLTSVTIPNSVTSIGTCAFSGCKSLTSPVYNAHCFAYMPTSYSGVYAIPEGIKQIAGGAFHGCSSVTSVTIGNSVTSIGDYAFSTCSSLTSVTIPISVTSIGDWAFLGCSSLTSVQYTGTKEQWDKIEKSGWADNSYIQVIRCTDGEIRL